MKEGVGAVGEGYWLWVFHALKCAEAIRRDMQSEWKVRRNRRNSCGETLRDAALGRGKVLYPGLRQTSSEHAAKHTVKAALLWQLG